MSLKEKIQEGLKKALKEKKSIEVSALRMLNSAILNREKEKRYKISREKIGREKKEIDEKELEKESQLTDEEVIEVVFSEIKKRKEVILEFSTYVEGYGGEKGKIEKYIEKEKAEMEILQNYLPKQLSEEEIQKLAKEAIEKVGAKEPKDMGKVMAELMPKLKGKTEGSLVSKIVKEILVSQNEKRF